MDGQRQDDQLEPTYNSSVAIQDVALKTNRERWTIEKGGGRGLERSALVARHDHEYVTLQLAKIRVLIESSIVSLLACLHRKHYFDLL